MSPVLYLLILLPAGLEVSNRAPKADEWGYRPANASTVRLNPPSLTWVHETEAASYTVQWSRKEDFAEAASATGVPWPTYTHHERLAPGAWHWRYRFKTQDGRESGWSARRSFVVPADAIVFPMPTRAEQRKRVPQEHPRLFLRPEDLPRLRGAVSGNAFTQLRAEADRLLGAEPTPEPATMGDLRDPKTAADWWPNRLQTLKACQEAETLAFVYLITREAKYGEGARKWIRHLCSWNLEGPTNFTINCEAAKPILHRLPRAYDWAYDALSPEDRELVRRVATRRAQDAWKSREVGLGVGHLNSPYSSHGQRTFHKLAENAIALLGDVPEAATWLDYAVNKFYATFPVWSDDDGGWHQGLSYWAGYITKDVWWLQVSQSALGIDGFKKPFFARAADYALYAAPPNSPNSGFGDLSFRPPTQGWGGFMQYFLRALGNRPEGARAGYWRWWTERWGMTGEGGILGFLYETNLGPLPAAKAPADLPPSKIFRGTGVANLHATLLDANDDVHVLFKSSPFGTQSHGHNSHNSIQLNAYGEALLPTCVYRDLHGSKFHTGWCHETVSQNAVLVDGKGQIKYSPAPHGRIVDSLLGDDWDYVVGDATDAYGGRLTRYRRHVLYAKPDVVVLYDDLAAKDPATFQFMLHGNRAFDVDENTSSLRIDLPKAGADIRYLSPLRLAFRQWDGYDPKPTVEFPNMWHVEAGTAEKRAEVGMLTAILPYRAGKRESWTATRIESETAVGVRIETAGKKTRMLFRKQGARGPASADGVAFEGPAAVVRR
jgi:hypothetical protein